MTTFPDGFLWGASTAPHQIEGNNLNSDFWANEGRVPGMERSGDACDSYHRYREDMQLLADAGLNSYRFGIEWARIEPEPGLISRAELAHYRRMIDTANELGITPFVTLHHFTNPRWFAEQGGWTAPGAIDRFRSYVETATTILDGVEWVATMNEPNMLAMMTGMAVLMQQAQENGEGWQSPTVDTDGPRPALPAPSPEIGRIFVEAHHAVRDIVRERTGANVGWTVANRAFETRPGGGEKRRELEYIWEDLYLEGSRGDDFVGVQSYSAQWVNADGIEPHPQHPDNTLVGTAYRPDALGIAVRHTAEVTGGVPIVVTENGIATHDDSRRIAYTDEALHHLGAAMADGVDVQGYLHWSLLDNYEWGHWEPTFGLIQVDRETFVRTPKPSLGWLGDVARRNGRVERAA
ncbi:beta-glucosidase [Leifsonia sp. 98AMF]|uniref:glycoside hydrolase family 1 protein n=1 Tax=unclassified Leifsonia TaxID=2663824 RepID=UPI000879E5B7|nr:MULTISPECIES: family 1 glycosylhydrolase [unclassified Leifsonia]SDH60875.1 beta-glucosidase [Leifsonia sp. 197AMF]SDI78268.1 beta-glucosidase [Leifsonia sp. 466MF]SDK08110.1 beta-glucosidase [Leifsonia sp. 157MF]SDN81728.1 beta-glucosidase [Leifsonia sp. 509MF]SEN25626.1 beta-glucosidase [Leifsonia sp. 467MF]